jgi:uncharacterized protein DUF6093
VSVNSVLAAGRTAALMLMRDTCTVERKSGETLDPDTGLIVETWTTVYPVGDDTGRCRVKPRTQREAEWGEREVALGQYVAGFPWDAAPEFRRGDRLTVLASDDTWLVGRHLEVLAIALNGTATTRRLLVEDREG